MCVDSPSSGFDRITKRPRSSATALGVTFPPSLLLRADQIIEYAETTGSGATRHAQSKQAQRAEMECPKTSTKCSLRSHDREEEPFRGSPLKVAR
jgi:hypothetical protein